MSSPETVEAVENKYLVAADDALEGVGGALRSFVSWVAPEPPSAAETTRNAQREIVRATRAADRKLAQTEKKKKQAIAELERQIASGAPKSVVQSQAQLVRSQDLVRNRTMQSKVNLQYAGLSIDTISDTVNSASSVRNLSAASSQLIEEFGGVSELRRTAMTHEREKMKAEQMKELADDVLYSAADIDEDGDLAENDGVDSLDDIVAAARQKVDTMNSLKKTVAPPEYFSAAKNEQQSIDDDLLQRLARLNRE
jgi:hypothetical protein